MSKLKISDSDFADRLQLILREKFNNNTSEFARAIGVAVTSLNRWLIGEADPSRTNLVRTAKASGVSLQWLAIGGDYLAPTELQLAAHNSDKDREGFALVDSFSVNVSAGFGSFNEGVTEPSGQEPYSDRLLADLGVKAHQCAVFWAKGNSMQPTIDNGDQLLVDLSKKEIQGNHIYLVQNGGSVWVKRVRMEWDGIELISDNKDEYKSIKISAEEAQSLQVIGQVVHIGHKLV